MGRYLIVLAVLAASAAGGAATTYLVQPDGSGDFATIQEAIDNANSGDVIELGDGTFIGTGNRDILLHGKPLTLRSQSGRAEDCVIDCQASSGDRHFGISVDDGAFGSMIADLTIQNAWVLDSGGGLQATETELTLDHCIFRTNFAEYDGGAICSPVNTTLTMKKELRE